MHLYLSNSELCTGQGLSKYSILTAFYVIYYSLHSSILSLISGLLKGAVDINPIISLTLRIFCSADSAKKDKFKVY